MSDSLTGIRPENVFDWDDGDEYTDKPGFLRIYWEDQGEGSLWHIDGIDKTGRYTESCLDFATLAEVLAEVPALVEQFHLEPEREWHPMTLGQIRGYLAGSFGVGDWSTTEPPFGITEVRETEHGVEYR